MRLRLERRVLEEEEEDAAAVVKEEVGAFIARGVVRPAAACYSVSWMAW